MVVKATITCGFVECLGQMWKSGEFCDFTVIVEDERIACHRCVLSACSGFFSGLLKSDMKERAEGSVTISEINKSTVHVILDSVYTGQDGLTTENMIDVWHACHQLQINFMIKECENFVMENMSTDNYLEIYEHANLLGSTRVTEFTHNFMMKNFEHFHKTETFSKLPLDVLRKMVDSQDLVVSSENLVVESILDWVSFHPQTLCEPDVEAGHDVLLQVSYENPGNKENADHDLRNETRKAHLGELMSRSRLYLCTREFIETLRYNEVIGSCTLSLRLIFDALMYKLTSEYRHNYWPLQAVHRKTELVVICAQTVVTCKKCNKLCVKFFLYNFHDKKFYNISQIETVNENTGYLTVFDQQLFYFNGRNLYVLEADKTWKVLDVKTDITTSYFTKLLPHGDYIYLLRRNTIFISDLLRMKVHKSTKLMWDSFTEDKETRPGYVGFWSRSDSIVSCGSYILFFITNCEKTSVTCYDPENGTTRELTVLDGTPNNIISFRADKTIYILRQDGSLWKAVNYSTDLFDLDYVSRIWDFTWPVHSAVFYMDQLFLFGPKVDSSNEKTFPTSLPGLFESVKIIQMDSLLYCPMFAPTSWKV